MTLPRRSLPALLGAALAAPALSPAAAQDGGTLRIAMTLATLPTQNGSPDQGTEGFRFMGATLYDALLGFDLSRADRPAGLRPGLATKWEVDAENRALWRLEIREGVRFHDGSLLDAQAVAWNFDKVLNRAAPQFDPAQSGQMVPRIPSVKAYRAVDARTLEIETHGPDSLLPWQLAWFLVSSPARWEAAGGKWDEFGKRPSGTGPWILERYEPRQQAVLRRNPDYWDRDRIPKTERLVLLPVPDAATRTAALLSGQADWIESPAPDMLDRLRSGGAQVLTGVMPHLWPQVFSRVDGSPLNDIRVRRALNLAIDREGMVRELLGGLGRPARGVVQPESPWFGAPQFAVRYDPAEAKRLLAEAGHGPGNPLALRFMIAPSGSGQMYPLPMNEFIQQNFRDVGVNLSFEVLEWQAMRARRDAGGAAGPQNRGIHALNNSWNSMDPVGAFLRHVETRMVPPAGFNWGMLSDPEFDRLATAVKAEFDTAKQDALLARIHERMVDEAVWLFVVHDVNPRAVSARVRGVVQAQSWFVDVSPVSLR